MTVLGTNVHQRTEYIVQSTFTLVPDPDLFLGLTVRRQRKHGSCPQIEGGGADCVRPGSKVSPGSNGH